MVASALVAPAPGAQDGFTLARVIPNDVFMYVAERSNPESEFIGRYWGEVFDALAKSGVGEDLMGLLGSPVGAERIAEVQRVKERMSQLLDGVDWVQLGGDESVFAELFVPPEQFSNQRPPIMIANMVWVARGSGEGIAENYEGLVAILEVIVEEVNNAAGTKALVLERTDRMGAKVASVNLLTARAGAPPLPLSVAFRDDLLIIGLREHLFDDVLGMINGSSSKKALADSPRFKAAFTQLPSARDTMMFFDMQAMLKPMRGFFDTLIGVVGSPGDITRNTDGNPAVAELNGRALAAYRRGDIEQALALTRQAYDVSSTNSIALYNLACFNALLDNKHEALEWLGKAVEGGFYAPRRIAMDSDLESLRTEPKYQAALSRATELALEHSVEDVAINAAKTGEVFSLRMQVRQARAENDYQRGLELITQAYAVAPKDSMVLYVSACFHALLGHEGKALDFLEDAVDAGFYCPLHMAQDSDLDSVRSHRRYKAALDKSRQSAAKLASQNQDKKVAVVKRLIDRVADAVGILDYSATIETTSGYATRAESIIALVPDAKDSPIYSLFGNRRQLTDFDRYLPRETVSFSVSGGLDLGELYKFVQDSFQLAGPKGEELLGKWNGIQQMLGLDFQEDVIGWIDGDSINVTLADGGSVWMMKVTNEQVAREKVAAAIEFSSTKLGEAVAKNPMMAGLGMLSLRTSPLEHEQLEGFQNLHFAMLPQPPVWGVADGHLIFGSSADAVALCIATARGDHPNIRSNARAMREAIVPSGPFTSVTLTDKRHLGDELMGLAQGISMATGMMGAFVPKPELRPVLAKVSAMLGKLAPVARKIDFYKSTATSTTFDGQAWRSRAVTHYFSPAERTASDNE